MADQIRAMTMTHWGSYDAEVRDGNLVSLFPFAVDPDPSHIGNFDAAVLTAPSRVKSPMVRAGYLGGTKRRQGRRGEDAFVPVSWDRAFDLVAAELSRVGEEFGNQAIFGGSYGWASAGRFHHAQSQLHRFLNTLGGYTGAVNTYSYAAAEVILPHVNGDTSGLEYGHTSWPVIAEHTELFVMFGGIPLKNSQVSAGGIGTHGTRAGLLACKQAGVEFVNISPIASDVEAFLGARQLWIRPNSDTAMMLALAFAIVTEGLEATDFLNTHCVGYEQFRAYLLGETDGQPKSPEWAAGLTEIPADIMRELAHEMASKRTLISVAWSLQRADNGEQPYWMAMTLAAIMGQIGLPGGGIGFGYGATNRVGAGARPFAWGSFPQGVNPVKQRIPVARIADMLLNPGEEIDYNGSRIQYPDIKLVYWAGGNPFHHHQDLSRLADAWQRPQTVIVNEMFWTSTAKHADIVLPVTSPFERNDIGCARGEDYIVAMHKLIEPVGESQSDFDIFASVCERLQLRRAFTENHDEMGWLRIIYQACCDEAQAQGLVFPDFEEFWRTGHHRLARPDVEPILWSSFRKDPVANPLKTPSGRFELFSARIAGFGYADCGGHATWREPQEWLGSPLAVRYPIHLISNQPRTRLHSQFDNASVSGASKVAGREPIWINPEDAAERGIADGDIVRVFSERGATLAGAVVTDRVRRSVAQLATGAWYDPENVGPQRGLDRHGNVNVLTRDCGTSSLAQGPSAQSLLVNIERYKDEIPAVLAFEPPAILNE